MPPPCASAGGPEPRFYWFPVALFAKVPSTEAAELHMTKLAFGQCYLRSKELKDTLVQAFRVCAGLASESVEDPIWQYAVMKRWV